MTTDIKCQNSSSPAQPTHIPARPPNQPNLPFQPTPAIFANYQRTPTPRRPFAMSMCPRSLQIGVLPGAAIGSLVGGAVITSLARRLSAPQARRGLFVRRRGRRPCARCSGFGISRCPLCTGEGVCVRLPSPFSHHPLSSTLTPPV